MERVNLHIQILGRGMTTVTFDPQAAPVRGWTPPSKRFYPLLPHPKDHDSTFRTRTSDAVSAFSRGLHRGPHPTVAPHTEVRCWDNFVPYNLQRQVFFLHTPKASQIQTRTIRNVVVRRKELFGSREGTRRKVLGPGDPGVEDCQSLMSHNPWQWCSSYLVPCKVRGSSPCNCGL